MFKAQIQQLNQWSRWKNQVALAVGGKLAVMGSVSVSRPSGLTAQASRKEEQILNIPCWLLGNHIISSPKRIPVLIELLLGPPPNRRENECLLPDVLSVATNRSTQPPTIKLVQNEKQAPVTGRSNDLYNRAFSPRHRHRPRKTISFILFFLGQGNMCV